MSGFSLKVECLTVWTQKGTKQPMLTCLKREHSMRKSGRNAVEHKKPQSRLSAQKHYLCIFLRMQSQNDKIKAVKHLWAKCGLSLSLHTD